MPRTSIEPEAQAYCRVLGEGCFSWAKCPFTPVVCAVACTDTAADKRKLSPVAERTRIALAKWLDERGSPLTASVRSAMNGCRLLLVKVCESEDHGAMAERCRLAHLASPTDTCGRACASLAHACAGIPRSCGGAPL